MLFVYTLLFFLLGTSVVAVPVVSEAPSVDEDFHETLRDRRQRVIKKMGWQKPAGAVSQPTKPVEPVGAERLVGWWRSTVVSKRCSFCFHLI